jgi:hypothetical protein
MHEWQHHEARLHSVAVSQLRREGVSTGCRSLMLCAAESRNTKNKDVTGFLKSWPGGGVGRDGSPILGSIFAALLGARWSQPDARSPCVPSRGRLLRSAAHVEYGEWISEKA